MPEWVDFNCFSYFINFSANIFYLGLTLFVDSRGNSLKSANGWERSRHSAWYISGGILCKCLLIPFLLSFYWY